MNPLPQTPDYHQQDAIRTRMQVLFSILPKVDAWFTGLPIKQYLKDLLFDVPEGVSNQIVDSGRWSAYAHFSPISAFQNLLDKHGIDSHKTVVAHPFLPPEFIQELHKRSCKIVSLDISKETLQWDPDAFQTWLKLEQSTQHIDLVIPMIINGLGIEVAAIIATCEAQRIQTLVYVSLPHMTMEIRQVLSVHTMGSVLLAGGDSIVHAQLNEFLDSVQLAPQKAYFSWFLESRTKALLEYHLRESQPVVRRLLSAYFYVLNQEYATFGFMASAYSRMSRTMVQVESFDSIEQAEQVIKECYYQMFSSALPDVLFTLERQFPLSPAPFYEAHLDFSDRMQAFHTFMAGQVDQQPNGSLEIPALRFGRSYSAFHIFSTNPDFDDFVEKNGYTLSSFPPIDQYFHDSTRFPSANLCRRFGLLLIASS